MNELNQNSFQRNVFTFQVSSEPSFKNFTLYQQIKTHFVVLKMYSDYWWCIRLINYATESK